MHQANAEQVNAQQPRMVSPPPVPMETSKDFSSQQGKFGSWLKLYG